MTNEQIKVVGALILGAPLVFGQTSTLDIWVGRATAFVVNAAWPVVPSKTDRFDSVFKPQPTIGVDLDSRFELRSAVRKGMKLPLPDDKQTGGSL